MRSITVNEMHLVNMQLEDEAIEWENWGGKIVQIGMHSPMPGMSSAFPSVPQKGSSGRFVANQEVTSAGTRR